MCSLSIAVIRLGAIVIATSDCGLRLRVPRRFFTSAPTRGDVTRVLWRLQLCRDFIWTMKGLPDTIPDMLISDKVLSDIAKHVQRIVSVHQLRLRLESSGMSVRASFLTDLDIETLGISIGHAMREPLGPVQLLPKPQADESHVQPPQRYASARLQLTQGFAPIQSGERSGEMPIAQSPNTSQVPPTDGATSRSIIKRKTDHKARHKRSNDAIPSEKENSHSHPPHRARQPTERGPRHPGILAVIEGQNALRETEEGTGRKRRRVKLSSKLQRYVEDNMNQL